jgi:hypothetical protein
MAIDIESPGANAAELSAALRGLVGLRQLEEHTTFYVDPAGNDGGDGSEGDPWATLQGAGNVMSGYDLNGFDATIHLNDGEYVGAAINAPRSSRPGISGFVPNYWMTTGLSTVFIEGNPDDVGAVSLTCMGDAMAGCELALLGSPTTGFCLKNFTLDYTSPNANSAVISGFNAVIFVGDGTGGALSFVGVDDGTTSGDCFNLFGGCYAAIGDNISVSGGFDYVLAVGPECAVFDYAAYQFEAGSKFGGGGAFAWAHDGGYIQFSGSYSGSPTGKRFKVEAANSYIDVTGVSGSDLSTLPGNAAGVVLNGGLYRSATVVLQDGSQLPTADPHIVGMQWNSAGTMKISAG